MKKLGLVLYDLQEAAKLLGVSYETARKYARQGRLRAVRVGRRYRVEEQSIRDFLRVGSVVKDPHPPEPGVSEVDTYRGRIREALALIEKLAPVIRRGTRKPVDVVETIREIREERSRLRAGE